MKKILFVFTTLCFLNATAQDNKNIDTLKDNAAKQYEKHEELNKVDWSNFITRDFVCIGQDEYNVKTINVGEFVQVRFFQKKIEHSAPISTQYWSNPRYTTMENSKVVSVKGNSSGAMVIILAAGYTEGLFTETIRLDGYTLRISGRVENTDAVTTKK